MRPVSNRRISTSAICRTNSVKLLRTSKGTYMRIDLKTIALLALLPTAQLFAQVERASVSGIVSDKTGAAMPGADSYLDTDNHVALAGVSESGSVGADRRLKLASNRRCSPCCCSPVPFF